MGDLTRIEKNVLILEFLGRAGKRYKNLYTFKGLADINDGDTWTSAEDAKFDKDWNWIMKAIDKIETITDPRKIHTLYFVEIVANQARTCLHPQYFYSQHDIEIEDVWYEETTKIKAAYTAVVKFIQWHNGYKYK